MKNRINNGFTLVELLIVITILGIVASIVIQAFLGYKNKTNTSSSSFHAQHGKVESAIKSEAFTTKFTSDNHSYIRFNTRLSNEWGVHDPDCKGCQ